MFETDIGETSKFWPRLYARAWNSTYSWAPPWAVCEAQVAGLRPNSPLASGPNLQQYENTQLKNALIFTDSIFQFHISYKFIFTMLQFYYETLTVLLLERIKNSYRWNRERKTSWIVDTAQRINFPQIINCMNRLTLSWIANGDQFTPNGFITNGSAIVWWWECWWWCLKVV